MENNSNVGACLSVMGSCMSYRDLFRYPLTEADRSQFVQMLGLRHARFRYLEMANECILRDLQVCGSHAFSSLEIFAQPDASILLYDHGAKLPVLRGLRSLSAWEALLPFPWSLLAPTRNAVSDGKLCLEPLDFLREVEELRQAMHSLETLWNGFEIVALSVEGTEGRLNVLLHLVRGACLFAGILPPEVSDLALKMDGGKLSSEELATQFGTQAAFFRFLAPVQPESDSPWKAVTQRLLSLHSSPLSRCEYRLHPSLPLS